MASSQPVPACETDGQTRQDVRHQHRGAETALLEPRLLPGEQLGARTRDLGLHLNLSNLPESDQIAFSARGSMQGS